MQTQRIILGFAIAIGGAAVSAPASAQEERGTFEQRMACTPDVMRLCSDQIPDVGRITACLRQNTALLGHACRAVFESNAEAPPPAARAPAPPVQRSRVSPPPVQVAPVAPPRPSPYDDDDQ